MRTNEAINTRSGGAGPLHAIGDAARLVGVSPSLLRVWEREGLVSPRRTPGGHRLYSADDVQRLRHIERLRRMDRLNAAAIRHVLGPVDGQVSAATPDVDPGIGRRLRALRTARGWSLADVAKRAGLSISFVSAVERGQSSISVGNLFKLADAYGTTVPGLSAERPPEQRSILHPEERPRFVAGDGQVVIEDLIASPGALEAQRIEILPGGGSDDPYTHPGEEFIFVLSGHLAFWIDEAEHYQLAPGDSLYFRSTQPHRWRNEGESPVAVLWINVPVVQPSGANPDRHTEARHRPHADGASPELSATRELYEPSSDRNQP